MQKTKIHIARKSQNIVEYFFFFLAEGISSWKPEVGMGIDTQKG